MSSGTDRYVIGVERRAIIEAIKSNKKMLVAKIVSIAKRNKVSVEDLFPEPELRAEVEKILAEVSNYKVTIEKT